RAEQALELHRRNGNAWGTAYSVFELGHSAADETEFARAKELAEECMPLARESGDEKLVMQATWLLAWALSGLGESERAQRVYEEVSEQALHSGSKNMRCMTLEALSDFALKQQRPADAVAMLAEAYQINREMNDTWRLPLIAS